MCSHRASQKPARDATSDAAEGDLCAQWVGQHQTALWRYLRLLGCPAAAAEEVTQDALLQGLRDGRHRHADPRTLAWLRTVARNLWWMECRRRSRRPEVLDADAVERAWTEHAEPDGGDAYLAALRECTSLLPVRERTAIELRYGQGESRTAIAARLELGEEGVKSLFERVRRRLRECVERRRRTG